MFRSLLKVISILVVCLIVTPSYGMQEEEANPSIKQQFERMMKYTTYQEYKVIPIDKLGIFWNNVTDTIAIQTKNINDLNSQLAAHESTITDLRMDIDSLKGSLQISESTNEVISFMGTSFNKGTYHLLVWSIIFILLGLAIFAYLMFIRCNVVTVKIKRELDIIRKELDAEKGKSREVQVRLKRELQTAVNTIDEMKKGNRKF